MMEIWQSKPAIMLLTIDNRRLLKVVMRVKEQLLHAVAVKVGSVAA